MAFNDGELTEEELMEVTAGITAGKTDEMLSKMSQAELTQLKQTVQKAVQPQERELTGDELFNVKAAQPPEMVEEMLQGNPDLFRKK